MPEIDTPAQAEQAIINIPIAEVHRTSDNPRKDFKQSSLDELKQSIRGQGLLQPISVRPRAAGGYEIILGERRYRCCAELGWSTIPAIVRHDIVSRLDFLRASFAENYARADFNPIERANGFLAMRAEGMSVDEIAEYCHVNPVVVSQSMRLLDLPEVAQSAIIDGTMTEGAGLQLVRLLEKPIALENILPEAISGRLRDKNLERFVSEQLQRNPVSGRMKPTRKKSSTIKALESPLKSKGDVARAVAEMQGKISRAVRLGSGSANFSPRALAPAIQQILMASKPQAVTEILVAEGYGHISTTDLMVYANRPKCWNLVAQLPMRTLLRFIAELPYRNECWQADDNGLPDFEACEWFFQGGDPEIEPEDL